MKTTYSIAIRLKRITIEDAYLSVPVTERILSQKEDGKMGIDFEKLVEEAIRISHDPAVDWQVENLTIEAHDVQKRAPEDRESYGPFK